jgi:hypothetical protein
MQAEEAVEIEHRFPRDIDARPHGLVLRLGVRHDNIQTVGGAALKNYDEALGARAGLSRAKRGASQKAGHRRGSDHGEGAIAKKYATSDWHKKSLSALSF